MNRFALLPLAFFANACADTEGYDNSQSDADTEVRDLVEMADIDSERTAPHTKAQRALVKRALSMFGSEARAQGCTPAGAAIGHWNDNSKQYRGLMVDMNAKPFATIKGRLTHDGPRDGELNGFSVTSSDGTGRLTVEGDWHRNAIQADVFSTSYSQNHPILSMTGGMRTNFDDGTGQFLALLVDCG